MKHFSGLVLSLLYWWLLRHWCTVQWHLQTREWTEYGIIYGKIFNFFYSYLFDNFTLELGLGER